MSKKVSILQSNYIPWKGYFDIINSSDVFVIYDDMQYTKRDWRNRNKIKTASGIQWLTIPVNVKGKFYQKINQTTIADDNWGSKHWKILEYNYKKAPYFKSIEENFKNLFIENDSSYLSNVNQKLIQKVLDFLHLDVKILRSEEFHLSGNPSEKLLGICKELKATSYLSGPAAKDYLDVNIFIQENLNVEWMDYSSYPVYNQLYPPFDHYVSIMDLLFMEGENAIQFLKSPNG